MSDISVDDIRNIYVNTLCTHKGTPIFFKDITYDKVAIFRNVATKKITETPFKLEEFSAPQQRIGYVNHRNNALYVTRLPVRRFQVGIAKGNVEVRHVAAPGSDGYRGKDEILGFNLPTLAEAMLNKYPSFLEAYQKAVGADGIWSFDKQFAIGYDGKLYYKCQHIADVGKGVRTLRTARFKPGFDYLSILLKDQDYGKAAKPIKA